EMLGCSDGVVRRTLRKFSIRIKSNQEYQSVVKASNLHLGASKKLEAVGIKVINSYVVSVTVKDKVKSYEFDMLLPDHNILIEVQGTHWHGLENRHWLYGRVRSKMWSDLLKYMQVSKQLPQYKITYISE